MKETFCCECGKPGKWPVCSACGSAEEKPVKKAKGKKKGVEHHVEYFEAIIQNRSRVKDEEVAELILKAAENDESLNAWQKEKDFYFSKVKTAKRIAQFLAKKYGLNLKETRKQTGYDRTKGKKKFKWSICLRDSD